MPIHVMPRPPASNRCNSCAARKNGFCCTLDADSLADFATRSFRTRHEQGTEISIQGEQADKIGVIASGLVKVIVITEQGDEHLLQILHTGQLVGDPDKASNRYSWEAASETVVCWMPKKSWETFLKARPDHFRAYAASMTAQLDELRDSMIRMRGRSTLQRTACWLLEQVPNATDATRPEISIVLSRRDLASLLDMTVETLCRALHQLDERGAIDLMTPDHVRVTDLVKLRVLGKCPDEAVGAALDEPALRVGNGRAISWTEEHERRNERPKARKPYTVLGNRSH